MWWRNNHAADGRSRWRAAGRPTETEPSKNVKTVVYHWNRSLFHMSLFKKKMHAYAISLCVRCRKRKNVLSKATRSFFSFTKRFVTHTILLSIEGRKKKNELVVDDNTLDESFFLVVNKNASFISRWTADA
jgi:hypothetical protein